jgi:hypothetical protein
MTKKKNNFSGNINLNEFVNQFSQFINGFEDVMGFIVESSHSSRKDAREIAALFTQTRSEAESIFSLFSAIAGMFSRGGNIFESLFGLLPGGGLLSALLGGSLAPAIPNAALHAGLAHTQVQIPAPTVVVNTQLEKAGMYKVYREGKLVAETRPGV